MRIGILRTSHLGDIIHTLPLAYVIKNFSSGYEIFWIMEENYIKNFENLSFIDKFIPFKKEEFLKSLKQIRKENLDIILDLQGLYKTQIISFFSNSCKRVGFCLKDLKEKYLFFLYHKKIKTKGVHIVEKNLSFADYLGIKSFDLKGYNLKEIAFDKNNLVSGTLKNLKGEKFGVFHPFSSYEEKNFPIEPLKNIIGILKEKKVSLILTYGPKEERGAKNLENYLKVEIAPLLSINEMAYLIEKSSFFIGPDTGFYHLADALGVPKIGYFTWHPPERNGNFFSKGLNFYKREVKEEEILKFLEEDCCLF
jgi:ADP-heptose:LPS heptosyltransferase